MSFSPSQLHVIAVINNPARYKSRTRLFGEFKKRMEEAGVHLICVEAAFGDRNFEHTCCGVHEHLQVRQNDEIWIKENLINLGVRRLPMDWEYMAWVDADVAFTRQDWAVETIHRLQHFSVVQMFQTAVDLGPQEEALQTWNGFGYSYANRLPEFFVTTQEGIQINQSQYYYGVANAGAGARGKFWHPGYAWAIRRDAYDDLGGLLEVAILGSGDHHMALSLIGKGTKAVPHDLHPNYMKHVLEWQNRANIHVRQNIGYVPGTLLHYWHGNKADRRYGSRWDILRKWQYDPDTDIKRDAYGILRLTHKGIRMRNDLRFYFHGRREDAVYVQE
jgi:hypothetical protein